MLPGGGNGVDAWFVVLVFLDKEKEKAKKLGWEGECGNSKGLG